MTGAAERSGLTPRGRLAIVVVLVAVLVVQGAIDALSPREPYPTVSMPKFGEVADVDGLITINRVTIEVVYSDGTTLDVQPETFLAPIPRAASRNALVHLFALRSSDPLHLEAPTVVWLQERAQAVGTGATPTALRVTWQPSVVDIRAVAVVPEGEPVVREVTW